MPSPYGQPEDPQPTVETLRLRAAKESLRKTVDHDLLGINSGDLRARVMLLLQFW
jgi:hypothetical protein